MQQWFAGDMKSLAKLNQILEGKRNESQREGTFVHVTTAARGTSLFREQQGEFLLPVCNLSACAQTQIFSRTTPKLFLGDKIPLYGFLQPTLHTSSK